MPNTLPNCAHSINSTSSRLLSAILALRGSSAVLALGVGILRRILHDRVQIGLNAKSACRQGDGETSNSR